MRVFVAIDLPEPVTAELEALQNGLLTGRPVPVENLHLTLSFLGDQPVEAVEVAHEALSTVRAAAFRMRLRGLGSFGKRTPQVIFADVEKCDELLDLERRIARALRHADVEFQKRRFRPHVTVARLPNSLSPFEVDQVRDDLAANATFVGSPFDVAQFHLYRSHLTAKAARHEDLASYDLLRA